MAGTDSKAVVERAKELLAERRHRIVFNDFVNVHLQAALDALSSAHFSVSGPGSNDEFVKRVTAYETTIQDLLIIVVLTAHWGDADGRNLLKKIFLRLTETTSPTGGLTAWLNLRWYPLGILMYAAGVSALAAQRFDMLSPIFNLSMQTQTRTGAQALVNTVMDPLVELDGTFKLLPARDGDRFPRSAHLFSKLKEPLDRLLFLGASFEQLFDRFEVLLALAFADLRDPTGEGDIWGPFGLFVFKQGRTNSPLDSLVAEATAAGDSWPLLSYGLFGGQSSRFLRVAEAFRQLVNRNRWG
jgi:hypothetical protein